MSKKLTLFTALLFVTLTSYAQIDKIVGRWKTIDDKDGSTKSIVHIFKTTNGKYVGKVDKLFKHVDKKCNECEGANKDKPVLGMLVINNMVEKDGMLTAGTILDPENGKVYRCNITFEKKTGHLNVRGSLDKGGFIGRSQVWIRE